MTTTTNPIFHKGETVIYGKHGRCTVVEIQEKTLNGEQIPFYKLEAVKNTPNRSTKQQGAIWVPINHAHTQGLRSPITTDNVAEVMNILKSREYFFSLNDNWGALLPQLDKCLQTEGAIGLAKVYSFLFVLRKRYAVPPSEVSRMFETVGRLLFREISDATQETMVSLEENAQKLMRSKLAPDQ